MTPISAGDIDWYNLGRGMPMSKAPKENPAAAAERKRIVALINREAAKLEDEGSPTAASIIRGIVRKIERDQ